MTEYQDKEINATHGEWFSSHYYAGWPALCRFQFRFGPVPSTGTKRLWRRGGHYYRKPQHIQMRRAYWKALADEIPLRQAWVEIPDPWDDTPRHRDRCWKAYRKTQYKPLTRSKEVV